MNYDDGDGLQLSQLYYKVPPSPGRKSCASSGGKMSPPYAQGATAFEFPPPDQLRVNAVPHDKQRRKSNAMLRRSLQVAEHLPYSVWPSASRTSMAGQQRFTVTPVAGTADGQAPRRRVPKISIEEEDNDRL